MRQPDKWRETIDPFSLTFHSFRLCQVLGYPHAGNDVFYVNGIWSQKEVNAFIKVQRQAGADVANEIEIIKQLHFPFVPHILDYSIEEPCYLVTEEMPGERLSVIFGSNENNESLGYLHEFGAVLSEFHHLQIDCNPVKDRKFFHIPEKTYFDRNGLGFLDDYLRKNCPKKVNLCFVHGDCHYANILWNGGHISAILDYELSGIGIKEFDIAWACLLRPGQKFLTSKVEIDLFLRGYSSKGDFDYNRFAFYYALAGSYFFEIGKNEKGYGERLINLISEVIR